MNKFFKKVNKGYTIIETMVAIAIFLVVIIAGMSALLSANIVHHKSENFRSVMDNLNFIIEDMARNIKTGYNYHCGDSVDIEKPQSCDPTDPGIDGIIFFESSADGYGNVNSNADQWGYKMVETNGIFNISKTVDGGNTWVQINSNDIEIDGTIVPFAVLGAEEPPDDTQQPLVIIKLVGNAHYKDVVTPFSLQTTVSQRSGDKF